MSAVLTHPSAVVTQFTIFCAVELFRLVTSDDIMTSLLKKVINIDQNSRSQTAVFSVQIADRIRRQSSEPVANSVHTSGGARVFAARGKRLCCRSPHPVAYLEI